MRATSRHFSRVHPLKLQFAAEFRPGVLYLADCVNIREVALVPRNEVFAAFAITIV